MSDVPHPSAVWEQVDRLCQYERLRNAYKLKKLLRLLVRQWLIDPNVRPTETFIGDLLAREDPDNSEKLTFDKNTGNRGYPSTKASLAHLRNRLNSYLLEPASSRDRVIINMHKGSYQPIIEFNPTIYIVPALDESVRRLVLRIKTVLDARSFAGVMRAAEYFHKLTQIDSDHFRRWSSMAFIPFAMTPIQSSLSQRWVPKAEEFVAVVRNMGFNPWECVFVDACIKASRDHEWAAAMVDFNTAKASSQSESLYYWWHTALLASMNKLSESIQILEDAVSHSARRNLAIRTDLAMLQIMARRYDEAEENLSSLLDITPASNALLASCLAILYEAQDRTAEALEATRPWFDQHKEIRDPSPLSTDDLNGIGFNQFFAGVVGLLCGRAGDVERANTIAESLVRKKSRYYAQSALEVSIAMIGAGDREQAVRWLNRAAFEEREPLAMWFHIFPPLRHLRNEVGFQKLLQNLGLDSDQTT